MDNRLTKKRFNEHMSYDWLKYVCIILAVILFWVLLFSMGKTKLKTSEIFDICVVSKYNSDEEFNVLQKEILNETSFIADSNLIHFLRGEKHLSDYLYARQIAKQGDLFILDNTPVEYTEKGELKKDEYGNILSQKSFFLEYVDTGLFKPIDTFLEEGVNLKYEDVEKDVLEYLDNSKTYKTKESKEKFIEEYKLRIEEIKIECKKLQDFLNVHSELAVKYTKGTQYNKFHPGNKEVEVDTKERIWGIKFDDNFKKIDNFLGNGLDNEGNKIPVHYALGVSDYKGENKPFEYEVVFVMNMLIERYY